ncbi:class I SAM-dependent methyltransferase [Aquisalimonas sp. 2447]|uniref:class I SAM-dependent methyltransferase n=1 Tax=Aquisalimonas sp. 2447 TaxID=2740807 RepID=UPI0014327321|nr:class I SAM-dependent methyltransferase [Aquisalimonas sp. 2447]QIT55487.1 class I SAM-dependent methyltransferase [Aquisalimonas sp. 2447]
MSDDASVLWDRRYQGVTPRDRRAAEVLVENTHLLPHQGEALDLAAGVAANAFVLARLGMAAEAWDQSATATQIVAAHARETGLGVVARNRDVVAQPPAARSFDVIVVSAFLNRDLCGAIADALRPGGLLFYQTYCQTRVTQSGPSNPDFLLADGELLQLFAGLAPVVYREEQCLGDPFRGFRDRAMLVARQPESA